MIEAPVPATESARLAELEALEILDTSPEQAYDDITYLASQICNTPIALVSLVDGDRQWFKSRVGLDATETERRLAFCAHAILDPGRLFVIDDATEDERFADNPLVLGDPEIRFYAGAPITTAAGNALGTLCVIDTKPRTLKPEEARALEALSRQVMTQLELRRVVAELEASHAELEASHAELRHLSVTDPLTSLVNRRALMAFLDAELERHKRYGHGLSLALIDLDDFKPYNDAHGHVAGDEALESIARTLLSVCRKTDIAARYGGDELVLVLPDTDRHGAVRIAERLRHEVEALAWPKGPITVSVGVAEANGATPTPESLIEAADAALYRAKANGRNRVA